MTDAGLMEDVVARGAPDPSVPNKETSKQFRSNLVLQMLAMIGLGAMLWPSGANWVSSLFHDGKYLGTRPRSTK